MRAKYSLFLLLIIIFQIEGFTQGYRVKVIIYDFSCNGELVDNVNGTISINGINSSFTQIDYSEVIFDYTFDSDPSDKIDFVLFPYQSSCGTDFVEINNFRLSSVNACREGFYTIETNYLINYSIQWSPVNFKLNTAESSSSGCYFNSEIIKLYVTPGYPSYNWEYSTGEGYKPFANDIGSGNSISFSWEDVFGEIPVTEKTVLFRASVGSCPIYANSGQYKVGGVERPSIESSKTVVTPACFNEPSGSIELFPDRLLNTGEVLTLTPFDSPTDGESQAASQSITTDGVPAVFNELAPRTYYIELESNQNFCGNQDRFAIEVPQLDQITFQVSEPLEILCAEGLSAISIINVNGGSQNQYSFSKDNGISYQASNIFTELVGGQAYDFVVKDKLGCLSNTVATIIPSAPAQISFSSTVKDPKCFDSNNGSITLLPNGGISPYSFSINSVDFQDENVFNNLKAGIYNLIVQDANGCLSGSQQIEIFNPDPVSLTLSSSLPSCNGGLGNVQLFAEGGESPYLFSDDNINFFPSSEFNSPPGVNTFYVKDANNCKTSITTTLLDRPPLDVFTEVTSVTCFEESNGAITILEVSNGTKPYKYSIDGGLAYTTSQTFMGLSAGEYSILVQDANSCEKTVTINIASPTQVGGTILETAISCDDTQDGALEVIPYGGSGLNYTFEWNTGSGSSKIQNLSGGTYSVTIRDSNACASEKLTYVLNPPSPIVVELESPSFNGYQVQCNGDSTGAIIMNITGGSGQYSFLWSNGSEEQDQSNLSAGIYSVEVKDSRGCIEIAELQITEPDPLSIINTSFDTPICFEGLSKTQITANGGIPPYQYSFDDGLSWQFDNASYLAAGVHKLLVEDASNCSAWKEIEILEQPDLQINLIDIQPSRCNNPSGSIAVSVDGGAPPYSFSWSLEGSLLPNNSDQIIDGKSGKYQVEVLDALGCSTSSSYFIPDLDGPQATVSKLSSTKCHNSPDGEVDVTISGGAPPYEVVWSNGHEGTSIFGLLKGLYQVTITDSAGCLQSIQVEIPGPDEIQVDTIIQNTTCFGESNGSIEVSVSGGTAPYNLLWSTGEQEALLTNLRPNTYSLTVSDKNNCSKTFSFEVKEPDQLQLTSIITPPSCPTRADGTIALSIIGGTEPYRINWLDQDEQSLTLPNLAKGTYLVEVIDANGCLVTGEYLVEDPEMIVTQLGDFIICEGQTFSYLAELEGSQFSWTSEDGFLQIGRELATAKDGVFYLNYLNQNQCPDSAQLSLTLSNDALNADFLMASEAITGDTIHAIDISWPIPDSLNWSLPEGLNLIDQSMEAISFIAADTGLYRIDMQAFLGNCVDYYTSSINVTQKQASNGGRIRPKAKTIIKKISASPNPSNGMFEIFLELEKAQQVDFALLQLGTNRLINKEALDPSDIFAFELNITNEPSGLYLLVVRADDEVRSLRLLKN